MLSRSSVYALQAALHLAQQPEGTPLSAAVMAERLELPPEYLAKVLRRLAVDGTLTSTRGAYGGYRLADAPNHITVARVVEPFEEGPLGTIGLGDRLAALGVERAGVGQQRPDGRVAMAIVLQALPLRLEDSHSTHSASWRRRSRSWSPTGPATSTN